MTAPRGRLVVSIHDVAPSTATEVRHLLAALDAIGATPRVLKVIPNEHGHGDLRDYPALARLLAGEAAAGSEIVLHGYTHRVAGPARGSWATRLRARLFTGTAAEFLTLDAAQMAERLQAGRRILRDIGLDSRGFCAPCWLAAPELPPLLRQSGFRYYTTMLTLVDLTASRRLWTPWLGYMGAGGLHERLAGLGGRICLAAAASYPLFKVFLHPQGALTSTACQRIVDLLARLVRARRPVTYADLLAG